MIITWPQWKLFKLKISDNGVYWIVFNVYFCSINRFANRLLFYHSSALPHRCHQLVLFVISGSVVYLIGIQVHTCGLLLATWVVPHFT